MPSATPCTRPKNLTPSVVGPSTKELASSHQTTRVMVHAACAETAGRETAPCAVPTAQQHIIGGAPTSIRKENTLKWLGGPPALWARPARRVQIEESFTAILKIRFRVHRIPPRNCATEHPVSSVLVSQSSASRRQNQTRSSDPSSPPQPTSKMYSYRWWTLSPTPSTPGRAVRPDGLTKCKHWPEAVSPKNRIVHGFIYTPVHEEGPAHYGAKAEIEHTSLNCKTNDFRTGFF